MADADEDVIPRSQPGLSASTDPDADPEDEAQDFRFLASLTGAKSAGGGALPKRGEKDFEPNPTQAQSNTLEASREAMHNALSVERVLTPHNPVVGQYLPDSRDWRWDVMPVEEGDKRRKGKGGRCVVVGKFRTTYARNIGVEDYRNWTWLLPEEALFLIERGTLDIRWPDEKVRALMKGGFGRDGGSGGSGDASGSEDEEEEVVRDGIAGAEDEGFDADTDADVDMDINVKDGDGSTKKRRRPKPALQVGGVPMSLQGAYASFIGKSGLTLERYNVYAGLRRLGYVVQRALTWDDGEDEEEHQEHYTNSHTGEPNGHITQLSLPVATAEPPTRPSTPATSLINRLVAYLFHSKPLQYRPSQGPLIHPGLYTNYNDIFRALILIPYYPLSTNKPPLQHKTNPKLPYTISWNVHKPSLNTKYRKSAPPPPDFRIAVLDARNTSIPTASEIGVLLDSMPHDELPKEKRMEMRLKHGVRNVILAVVDCGIVSYIRLADMCSGSEGRVFETKVRGGVKKGGGWKRGDGAAGRGRGGRR